MAQAGMSSSKAHGVSGQFNGGWARIGRLAEKGKPESSLAERYGIPAITARRERLLTLNRGTNEHPLKRCSRFGNNDLTVAEVWQEYGDFSGGPPKP